MGSSRFFRQPQVEVRIMPDARQELLPGHGQIEDVAASDSGATPNLADVHSILQALNTLT